MVAMAGINPIRYLMERDPLLRKSMEAIARRYRDIAAEERQDLAERIIAVLGRNIK
jgi:hypothetical protein